MNPPTHYVVQGDCLAVLKTFPDASISAVVTDPPYGLSKEPDMAEVVRHWCAAELRAHAEKVLGAAAALALFPQDVYTHGGSGFMGKSWDSFVPGPEVWREVLRVLKPGGHALVFSGTRTYDLTVLAMRIAGFEIRDQLAWMYGSGFPKSLDVSKAIGQAQHAEPLITQHPPHYEWPDGSDATAWSGWGTALKPAQEPIVLARKPLVGTVAANVLEFGTGAINVDGCRVGPRDRTDYGLATATRSQGVAYGEPSSSADFDATAGRWPANVIMDEAAGAMLDEQSGDVRGQQSGTTGDEPSDRTASVYPRGTARKPTTPRGDIGGASRFFYCAKTSRAEREAGLEHLPKRSAGELTDRTDGSDGLKSPRAGAGRTSEGRANTHPTVKPIALMRWLVRLITPPGGIVLDPYCGSGSTLCAAVLEGVTSVGIELTPEYIPIIEGRVAYWKANGAKLQTDALNEAMRGVFSDESDAGGSYQ